jgi:hypothetical protein
LAAHYERLRREAIRASTHGKEGLGLALFLRRGMAAWIEAWSQCITVEKDARSRSVSNEVLPSEVRSQIATLLAGMILNLQTEATS